MWIARTLIRLGRCLADAQADLSLRWVHTHFVGFVMKRLICYDKNLKIASKMHVLEVLWMLGYLAFCWLLYWYLP